jgi:uncharacterized membrane protein
MTDIAAMLNAYPAELGRFDDDAFVRCIEECLNCAQACTACADACLAESERADLARCISATLNCADVCEATMRVVSRHTGYDREVVRALLAACVETCRACYDECRKHALEHEHCRICADACHRCVQACQELLSSAT